MPTKRKAPASVGYADSSGNAANERSARSHPARKVAKKEDSKATNDGEESSDKDVKDKSNSNGSPAKEEEDSKAKFDHSRLEERYGIVQREFYPPEMSNERCAQYNANELPRPIEQLHSTLSSTESSRAEISVGKAVVHWFKRDLRLTDNTALSLASAKARNANVPLICIFVVSGQDYQAHLTSPARVDFELRTLAIMKEDLAALDIPLYVTSINKRKEIPGFLLQKFEEWGVSHVYCNIEYEVDELRRETKMAKQCLEKGISFTAVHDDVVVAPGELSTGQGKQYAVYSPWFRSWLAHLHKHPELLDERDKPTKNPSSARKAYTELFSAEIPPAPPNKTLPSSEQKRLAKLWPAGEHEALARLEKFLNDKVGRYKETRNFPAEGSTAMVSVHHSAGTLVARTSVRLARDKNSTKKLDGGVPGIAGWIGEVAWRDFYKHVLAHWPYVCMHKPFKYEYTNVPWSYSDPHLAAWQTGHTGYPIVDASMRQLNTLSYMHNRCRMIVASFLSKDLLLDWRLGERYFMEHLIDGDFASNNGGWGFAASVGVDPQPYFRIFNPVLQSEKFDAQGQFIRKWVPELRDVEGKAVHDPWGRGAADVCERNGYPKPVVVHKEARDRALKAYKAGLGRDTA
ncbi:hypothetical protein K490DRAFT_36250 [Saccharata proteae CBS 121410]|uniref:Photolyase/cryptochrome alpha/beta domain-containing protein n=1 Tax=Saccharata proteae CBS 121410 TaxID=1314787 RepID=A0A9P4HVB1_9PEZI|nr:hypothetical protein K490DRAFT_36250 [Saccharata proteae CBS 121410]